MKAHRIGRAVIGHLLAAEERRNRLEPLNEAPLFAHQREYFLDTSAVLTDAQLYLWPYASSEIVVARTIGLINIRHHDLILGDVLKFFPLAFWLVSSSPPDLEYPFTRLPLDEAGDLDAEVELSVSLERIPRPTWPERPTDYEVVLMDSDRSHVARPSPHRKAGLA